MTTNLLDKNLNKLVKYNMTFPLWKLKKINKKIHVCTQNLKNNNKIKNYGH